MVVSPFQGFSSWVRSPTAEAVGYGCFVPDGTLSRATPNWLSSSLLMAEFFVPVLDHADERWRRVFQRFHHHEPLPIGGCVVAVTPTNESILGVKERLCGAYRKAGPLPPWRK